MEASAGYRTTHGPPRGVGDDPGRGDQMYTPWPQRRAPSRPSLRERKKLQTRSAIINRAVEIFNTQGFYNTSIDDIADIAKRLGVDNGPEFISKALDAWAYQNGLTLDFSRPGKPTDNAFVESFNGHFRQECLDQHWFASLEEARQIIEAWRIEYNTERPHQALKYGTPTEFLATWEPPKEAADEPIRWTKSGFRSGAA